LGTSVMEKGGVVTNVTSYGARTLAYEFKRPGERHFEAQFVKMGFNAPPSLIADVEHTLRIDERVLRWMFTKKRALKRLNDFKASDPRNPNSMQSYDGGRGSM